MIWLEGAGEPYDAASSTSPTPQHLRLALYTRASTIAPHSVSRPRGLLHPVTSPLFRAHVLLLHLRTIEAARFHVRAYHTAVPSFASGVRPRRAVGPSSRRAR